MITACLTTIIGILMTGYYFCFFDPTVQSGIGSGRTINLGLMADRQNGIVVGLGLAILGVITAVSCKFLLKEPQKVAKFELLMYAVLVVGTLLNIMLGTLASYFGYLFDSTKAAWEKQNERPPASAESSENLGTNNRQDGSATSIYNPSGNNGSSSAMTGAASGFGVSTSSNSAATGNDASTPSSSGYSQNPFALNTSELNTNWGEGSPTGGMPNQPDPTGLKKQNAYLIKQIKSLQQKSATMQDDIQRFKQQLAVTTENLTAREKDIDRLYSNLRITNQIIQSKDGTIAEMTNTIGRLRIDKSSETHTMTGSLEKQIVTRKTRESIEVSWPNVQDFQPMRYKNELWRRLSGIAGRKFAQSGTFAEVKLHFTIERDGRPTNIVILTPNQDDETRRKCGSYIEAAGPFRPLLPVELSNLEVDTELTQLDDIVQIKSLQISALGNIL